MGGAESNGGMGGRDNRVNAEEEGTTAIEMLVLWLLLLAWPVLFVFSMYLDTRVPIELEVEPSEDMLFGQVSFAGYEEDGVQEYHEWN